MGDEQIIEIMRLTNKTVLIEFSMMSISNYSTLKH